MPPRLRSLHLGLLAGALAVTSAACLDRTREVVPGVAQSQANASTTDNGRYGVHGMVVFGGPEATYFSHIPVFGAPHDLQVVMRVELEAPDLPATFQDRLYTFVPEPMSLDDVVRGTKTTFTGSLFLDNFEHEGVALLHGVQVEVRHVALARQLDPTAAEPQSPEYLLIGKAPNTTRIALIYSPETGMDEITPVSLDPSSGLTDEALEAGVIATAQPTFGSPPGTFTLVVDGVPVGGTSQNTLSCLTAPDFFYPCP